MSVLELAELDTPNAFLKRDFMPFLSLSLPLTAGATWAGTGAAGAAATSPVLMVAVASAVPSDSAPSSSSLSSAACVGAPRGDGRPRACTGVAERAESNEGPRSAEDGRAPFGPNDEADEDESWRACCSEEEFDEFWLSVRWRWIDDDDDEAEEVDGSGTCRTLPLGDDPPEPPWCPTECTDVDEPLRIGGGSACGCG